MTLIPSDMLAIQTAIDAYEKKFPRRPSPSAEKALAWHANKSRGWKRFWVWRRVIAVLQIRTASWLKRRQSRLKVKSMGPLESRAG